MFLVGGIACGSREMDSGPERYPMGSMYPVICRDILMDWKRIMYPLTTFKLYIIDQDAQQSVQTVCIRLLRSGTFVTRKRVSRE